MKFLFFLFTFSAISSFAEHDATYCGKMLDSRLGRDDFFNQHPDALLAVEERIVKGESEPWFPSYAAVYGINQNDAQFIQKAVRSSKLRGTLFCVKARWGGAAYSSTDIKNISLITDSVIRIDYMSAFLRSR